MSEAEPDPGGAEHGRGDRDRRGLSGLGDPMQEEREHDGREQPRHRPVDAAELGAQQRKNRAGVRGQDHRAQRSDHQGVLVQCQHRRHRSEREEPPSAGVHEEQHDRQTDHRDEDARHERTHEGRHRPPKRRLRLA